MSLSEVELAQRASARYAILIIGGDAVFLADRLLGHKLYMGPSVPVDKPAFREYVLSLNHDLERLSTEEFFNKYGLAYDLAA